MVRLDCSGVWYGSQLDEKHLFTWAEEIPGFVRWEGDTLLMQSRKMSQMALRDLIALLSRYDIPMQQLAQFMSARNEHWFAATDTYWHQRVFGL